MHGRVRHEGELPDERHLPILYTRQQREGLQVEAHGRRLRAGDRVDAERHDHVHGRRADGLLQVARALGARPHWIATDHARSRERLHVDPFSYMWRQMKRS